MFQSERSRTKNTFLIVAERGLVGDSHGDCLAFRGLQTVPWSWSSPGVKRRAEGWVPVILKLFK